MRRRCPGGPWTATLLATLAYIGLTVAHNELLIPWTPYLISVRPSIFLPMLAGLCYGPVRGFAAGFLGNLVSDALSWGEVWVNWSAGVGLMGVTCSLLRAERPAEQAVLAVAASAVGVGFAVATDLAFGLWSVPPADPLRAALFQEFLPAFLTDSVNGAVLLPLSYWLLSREGIRRGLS
ncbi:MAG: hypothetical protein DRO06_03470 [Thermoproteota archaeon]|nr:MAG: hypothetical protein DRO06_03470 [Candidatus Korarchaeota archaeon]